MRRIRTPYALAFAIALSLAVTPALAGCSGNPLQTIVKKVTGGNVDIGSASLPDGFPTDVPLYTGKITYGASLGTTPDVVYNVTMKVKDAAALDEAKKLLEDAGFTIQAQGAATADGGTIIAESDKYGVLLVVAKDADGFIANYSVTPKQAGN